MNLSRTAKKRLEALLPRDASGFAVEGFMGTCRGSTPVMHPARQAEEEQETLVADGITFFLNADIAERFTRCNLDYDRSFLGKGLTASWPQCDQCACHS